LSPSKFGVRSILSNLLKFGISDNKKVFSKSTLVLLTSLLVSLSHKTRLALYG